MRKDYCKNLQKDILKAQKIFHNRNSLSRSLFHNVECCIYGGCYDYMHKQSYHYNSLMKDATQ